MLNRALHTFLYWSCYIVY